MKLFNRAARLLVAIAASAALTACGGGYTSISIGGKVTGLTTNGLVLANGTSTVTLAANQTSYTFPTQIGNYDSYSVSIQSQPTGLTCALANSAGTATGVDITWVNVSCTPKTHTLGGIVNGLTGSGLKLANGSDNVEVAAGSSRFTFPTSVAEGTAYGVVVLNQPSGQNCTVTNGTATMSSANVDTTVQVNCM